MANTEVGHRAPVLVRLPLRKLRKERGWSLSQAADRAQMDQSHLSKVERGLAGLSVDTLARLAVAYELTDLALHLSPYVREAM